MKQYMKDTPIQRGFKHWCRNDSRTGYVMYTGKNKSREVGLAEAVVLQLTRKITGSNIRIYIDNFYTSPSLLSKLKQDAIFCTGTVRHNRKGMPKDFIADRSMTCGAVDARHCNGIFAIKCMDNKAVYLLSTITSSNEITVRRRQKGQKEKVNVSCPAMIRDYNNGMNGTDVMDQRTKPYAFDRRSPTKYYTRPFVDYLEMAVVNSFIVQEKLAETESASDRPKTLLDFKRKIALSLISSYTSRARSATLKPTVNPPSSFHRVSMVETKGRCKFCYTQGQKDVKVFTKCETCQVHLCISKSKDCYNQYHEKK